MATSILNFAFTVPVAAAGASNQYKLMTFDASGDAALASAGGDVEGVMQNTPAAIGDAAELWRGGITKAHAGAAVSIGDNIASDATGRAVTAVAGDSIVGVALTAAGAAGVIFSMLQVDRSDAGNGALSRVLADVASGAALSVAGNGQTPIVTVGAETRTMADASYAGQLRLLYFKTDGGDCVITFASPIDQLGTLTYTFDDVGEYLLLVGVEDGADVEWRIAGQDNGHGSDENVIADPGTGVAIPVTASGSIAITTAAAETNTLAIPTFVGQRLTLFVDTYAVGDRVVTAASAINVANNTIMTFGAVSESITLQAITVAGALAWTIAANDNVSLS